MAYISDDVTEAFRRSGSIGIFFRLGTEPPLHLWMGIDSIEIGMGSTTPDGTRWIGAGRLLDIPDLELLINGVADQVTFSLSMDAPVFDAFLTGLTTDAPEVRGATAVVGVAPLDALWQPTTSVVPLWTGVADFWEDHLDAAKDPSKSATRTIALTIGVGDTSRAQNKMRTFTSADQRLTSPDDRFFERVSRYVQNYVVAWPDFG